jgi:two-component system, chemotaxis family, CheB/CheR fusion protein
MLHLSPRVNPLKESRSGEDKADSVYSGVVVSAGGLNLPSSDASREEASSERIAYEAICSCLKERTRVDFTHYRISTLRRRINRRMVLRNIDNIEDYAKQLGGDDAEVDRLFGDILISVTSFFRDPEAFQSLKVNVLPRLLQSRGSSPLRVWVPACSTGDEAYSIAICIIEYLGEMYRDDFVRIFGTDVNSDTIDVARAGVYSPGVLENVSPERLRRFFTQLPDGRWQVQKSVRDLCTFDKHDVLADPPLVDMDLISCRNLLIYFDPTLQERVVKFFHIVLRPDGFLMLGKSESAAKTLFEAVDKGNKIFSRKSAAG